MRALCAALALAVAGCGPAPKAAKRDRAPAKPGVAATVSLPGDDGRVHLVDVPMRHETARCLVHVGPGGSSIACLPATELPATELPADR